jgi:hypothetical protein
MVAFAVCVAVGLLMIVLALKVFRSKYVFELYEEGIIAKNKKEEKCLRYEEIGDLLAVASGKHLDQVDYLAFRKNPDSEWIEVPFTQKDYLKLIEAIRELQDEARGIFLSRQLVENLPVEFHYVEKSVGGVLSRWFNVNLTSRFEPCKTLRIFPDHLEQETRRIPFEEGDFLEIDESWVRSDRIVIKNKDGQEKFAIPCVNLLSASLFAQCLSKKLPVKE